MQRWRTLHLQFFTTYSANFFYLTVYTMRVSWITIVSGLCTTAFTYETQQVMGGPDLGRLHLGRNTYKCENGKQIKLW